MTSATRARFAELVRSEPVDVGLACLLIGGEVEPDLEVDDSLEVLDRLAGTVRVEGVGPAAAAEALRLALGERAGFAGAAEDYDDLRSSLLHEVLRRGRGLPILLSVVWCEVAARIGVPAVPLGRPGHVLVCLGDPEDEHVVVDPFAGGRTVQVPAEPVLDAISLLQRVLTNIRVLTERQGRSIESTRTCLWATELALLLPTHPVDLRRERGELLARLGDFVQASQVLEAYAALIADVDDRAAQKALRQAHQARARLN